jgi:CHRD domain-containing protein
MHVLVRRRAALRAGVVAAVIAGAMVVAGPAGATTYSWTVGLSGATQTASGVAGDPDGSGTSNINANTATNQLCSSTTWANIAGPVVAGHIHEGEYKKPENPAVTINLFGPNPFGAASGAGSCQVVPGQVIQEMVRFPAAFTVVVHNQQFPVGAIRGQFNSEPLICEVSSAFCMF